MIQQENVSVRPCAGHSHYYYNYLTLILALCHIIIDMHNIEL